MFSLASFRHGFPGLRQSNPNQAEHAIKSISSATQVREDHAGTDEKLELLGVNLGQRGQQIVDVACDLNGANKAVLTQPVVQVGLQNA